MKYDAILRLKIFLPPEESKITPTVFKKSVTMTDGILFKYLIARYIFFVQKIIPLSADPIFTLGVKNLLCAFLSRIQPWIECI